ncbi:MATE family efflux transporter [Confluentibacter flavum]|uniref:Uncharacterized protein n=1 Tax=Confluentibacter flavum TaxID=1909700 RepID=A0A2N3HLA8_9FLAO|nr:MATE family efflux transporter [Confluentibacter flavum]PKQ45755.1 hypothetical protein CSW08_06725 [Confluentibacter flavum]
MTNKFIFKIRSFFLSGSELSIKVKKNVVGLIFIKGYSLIISFLLVPITLEILGSYKYGIWITIFNILAMIQILDIGIGNGLRNMLTSSNATNNINKAKEYVSTAYIMLGFISLLLCALFIIPWNYIDWAGVFNTDNSLKNEIKELIGITFVLTLMSFFLNLINIILTSYHKPALSSLIFAFSNTIVLALFLIFKVSLKENLIVIGLIYSAVPIIVLVVASILLFSRNYYLIRPSFRYFKRERINELLSLGSKFFIIQISILIIFQTDSLIISHFLDPSEVTPYSIVYKYFSIISTVVTIILTPFWAAYSHANEKKDFLWIKNILVKQFKSFILVIVLIFLMLIVSKPVISLWLGNNLSISLSLIISMAIFTLINVWNIAIGTFLNGINRIKVQLICSVIGLIINIPLSIYLIKEYGVTGVIIATSMSLLFFSIFGAREVLKVLKEHNNFLLNR